MEEKKELLDYIEENIRFFKNINKETFNILRKDKLTLEDYILLTPLLKQLTNYALVANIMEDEINEVFEFYDSLGEILGICNSSDCLVNILIEEKCNHPTIKNYVNCLNGISLRTDIFSIAYTLVDDLSFPNGLEISEEDEEDYSDTKYMEQSDSELNAMIDLRNSISIIEEQTNELLDFMFKYILFSSKEKGLSDVDILNYLVSYSNMKVKVVMLINDYNFNVVNNSLIVNLMNEENLYPTFEFNYGNMVTSFSDMFIDLEKMLENDVTYKNINKMIKMKDAYHLYQSYRFNYLKNLQEEKKILNIRKNY